MRRRLPVLVLAVWLAAGSARAATPEEQRLAQALFDDGRRLMDAGAYAEACPKLAESQRLDPGGGTLLNLAICYEGEGKLATAKAHYADALAQAQKDRRKDREDIARTRMERLEGKVPRVTVVVPAASDVPGLSVRLDRLELPRVAWGVATEVDPGAHVVEASVPGRAPWSATLAVDPAEDKVVEVPRLAEPPPLPPPPPPEVGGLAPGVAPPAVVVRPTRANPVYWGALGVAAAGGITSAVTGALALSAYGTARDGCLPDRDFCRDQESADAAGRARTLAWVSTVALGVGVAGLVTAWSVPKRVEERPAQAGLVVLPGAAALVVRGAF